jgi:hypothetical protein
MPAAAQNLPLSWKRFDGWMQLIDAQVVGGGTKTVEEEVLLCKRLRRSQPTVN